MAFCGKCGTQVDETLQFCPACGQAVTVPAAAVRRNGNRVVVHRGASLPGYCVKCGAPADEKSKPRNFIWYNPMYGLWILLGCIGILVFLGLYYANRKQMQLAIPLCAEHRRLRRRNILIGTLMIVTSPLLLLAGFISQSDAMGGGGAMLLLAMLCCGGIVLARTVLLRATRIDDQAGEFKGAGPAFLQRLEAGS
jgi:hypothetical protein